MRKRYLDLDDDDCEVKDGESVSSPVYLMDTTPVADADLSYHRPGYRVSDAASESRNLRDLDVLRDAARRERSRWIARMVDSWKTPPLNKTDPREINQSALAFRHEPDNASSLTEWREHMRRPDDGSEPDLGSRPWEIAAHERGEPDHDIAAAMRRHQRRRDAAWNSYKDRISRAYLQGRTDPSRATEIERQGERWRHGR